MDEKKTPEPHRSSGKILLDLAHCMGSAGVRALLEGCGTAVQAHEQYQGAAMAGRHSDKAGRCKDLPARVKLRSPVMAAEVREKPSRVDEYSEEAGLPACQGQDQVRTVTVVRGSAVSARQVYSGKACPGSAREIKSCRVQVSGIHGQGCDAAAA